ncbi:hypothetical protein [Celerinatantimonas sp. YJH-8]|uniref:hypothetical protein n=1 Tax=Celerinatantimonas sp. YJH-8 TaxID=3228714 RepID=UPI0038C31ACE
MEKLIALIMLVLSIQAFSDEVDSPDYTERVNLLTELAVSVKSCEHAGMIVDWDKVKKIPDQLQADAIREGIDVKFAQSLMLQALREKMKNEAHVVKYYQNHPDKADAFVEYWGKRCADLATNAVTKEYIRVK